MQLRNRFYNQDACLVARQLLGKVIRRRHQGQWLAARIIETEAYYRSEKASHSSLGFTHARRAMFMPAGTIYMYHARGHASLNISAGEEGDAVLIKSAYPYEDDMTSNNMIELMQSAFQDDRPQSRLCKGQTLLCRALRLSVEQWNAQQFSSDSFYIDDAGLAPEKIISTRRLGIPQGRDEHLQYRFIDYGMPATAVKTP